MKKTLMPHKCPECGKWSRLEYTFSVVEKNAHAYKFISITCKYCGTRVSLGCGLDNSNLKKRFAKKLIVKKFKQLHDYVKN